MFWFLLFFGRNAQVLHSRLFLLYVYRAQSPVEQHLTRVQSKIQAQLLILDISVSSQEPKRVVEIRHRLLKIANQEIRNALLEVCNCKVMVPLDGSLIELDLNQRQISTQLRPEGDAHGFLVFSQRSMYDPTIEEYLCCVWNVVEGPQR